MDQAAAVAPRSLLKDEQLTVAVTSLQAASNPVQKIEVKVENDHIERLTTAKPILALSELIWNAYDADAPSVRVEFEEGGLTKLALIRIQDNGDGIPFEEAEGLFKSLGGSTLPAILEKVIDLPKAKQEELAELLRKTTLTAVINAAKAVTDRLDFTPARGPESGSSPRATRVGKLMERYRRQWRRTRHSRS
jgi:hypothetical protein